MICSMLIACCSQHDLMEQLESITQELQHTTERARASDAQRLTLQHANEVLRMQAAGMSSENTSLRAAVQQR